MSLKMGHLTTGLRKVENELCSYKGAMAFSRQSERKGQMPSCTGQGQRAAQRSVRLDPREQRGGEYSLETVLY